MIGRDARQQSQRLIPPRFGEGYNGSARRLVEVSNGSAALPEIMSGVYLSYTSRLNILAADNPLNKFDVTFTAE